MRTCSICKRPVNQSGEDVLVKGVSGKHRQKKATCFGCSIKWGKKYEVDYKHLTPKKIAKLLVKVIRQKCDKGHKLKVVGHSCCDDIVECKCGKWYRCGIGGFWPYYEKK